MSKKKRLAALMLTLVLLVVYGSVSLLTANAAGDSQEKPGYTMGDLRLNASTGTVKVSRDKNEQIYLFVRFTSLTNGHKTVEDFDGKFTFYWSTESGDRDPDSQTSQQLGEPTEAVYWKDVDESLKELYWQGSARKDDDIVAVQATTFDTTQYAVGQKLYLWVYYEGNEGSYYATQPSNNNRTIEIVASTSVALTVQSSITYGDSATASATVSSNYGMTQGTLNFYLGDDLIGTTQTTPETADGVTYGVGSVDIPAEKLKRIGDYPVRVTFTVKDTELVDSSDSKKIEVEKRNITVTAEDVELQVGDPLPEQYNWSITEGSLVFEDELKGITVTPGIENTTVVGSDVLVINQAEGSNPNYAINFQDGTIKVEGAAENTPPEITNKAYSKNATKEDVPVTFTVNDKETAAGDLTVTVKYGITGAEDVTVTNADGNCSFNASKNDTYYITVTDGELTSKTSVSINTIDRMAPEVEELIKSSDDSVSGSVTVTINADDDAADENGKPATAVIAEIASIKVDGTEITGNKFVASENRTYQIVLTDKAGNETNTTVTIDNIDVVKPVIETPVKSTEAVTNEAVLVTVPVVDEAKDSKGNAAKLGIEGLDSIEVDGDNITGNVFEATENGTYTVKVTDKAGNVSETTVVIDNIDKAAPQITVNKNTDSATNKDVVVEVLPTDPVSEGLNPDYAGIDKLEVKNSGGQNVPVVDGKFAADKNDDYTIVVTDKAGNEKEIVVTVDNIDTKGPEVITTVSATLPTEKPVEVVIDAKDQGIDKTAEKFIGINSVTVNGKPLVPEDGKYRFTADKNGQYEVIVKDSAGNEDRQIVIIDNIIDKQTPVVKPENPTTPTTPQQPENPSTSQQPENPSTSQQPENPSTSQQPENPSTPEQSQGSSTPSQAPSTGDAAPVALYAILMLAALVSATGCVVRKRKAD